MPEGGEGSKPRAVATMIGLIRDQLAAQLEEANSNFGNTLTLIGIDATLIGVAIAGAGQLGGNYWVVLVGLLVTVALLLFAIRTHGMSLGPSAVSFYEAFGSSDDQDFETQLLIELDAAFAANGRALQVQQARILRALVLILIVTGYAVLLAVSSGHGGEREAARAARHDCRRLDGPQQGEAGIHTRRICRADHQLDSRPCGARCASAHCGAGARARVALSGGTRRRQAWRCCRVMHWRGCGSSTRLLSARPREVRK
jgi:hypothetical protein